MGRHSHVAPAGLCDRAWSSKPHPTRKYQGTAIQKIQKRSGLVWKVSYMGRSNHGVVSNDFPVERMALEVAHFLLDKMARILQQVTEGVS
jgi:hypothetical protein